MYIRRVYHKEQYLIVTIFHDNSAVHIIRLVQAWFEVNPYFQQIAWLAKSPDFNPIENIWGRMKAHG